jgi:alkanesulfonate monooxygenase SsuD/methylene tetrahydromethanopterin reductase-like flavin-dependent oxidoreductase (luciferase family)
VVLGALNARMLRLAGELADGVLLNYLPASAVGWCVDRVREGEVAAGRESGRCTVYAYVHAGVCDPEEAFPYAQRDLFSYAVADGYARAFRRAGFGDEIDAMQRALQARDRDGAVRSISRRMADAIDVCGDAATVTATMKAYLDAGVDHAILMPLPWRADRAACIADTIDAAFAPAAAAAEAKGGTA